MINSSIKESVAYKHLVLARALGPYSSTTDKPILYLDSGKYLILHHMNCGKSEISYKELPKYIENLTLINDTIQRLAEEYCIKDHPGNLAIELGYNNWNELNSDEEFVTELNEDATKLRNSISNIIELISDL